MGILSAVEYDVADLDERCATDRGAHCYCCTSK